MMNVPLRVKGSWVQSTDRLNLICLIFLSLCFERIYMSKHKTPLTELERKGLEAHGLGRYIGQPSQLADAFRQGVSWALSEAKKESVDETECWICGEEYPCSDHGIPTHLRTMQREPVSAQEPIGYVRPKALELLEWGVRLGGERLSPRMDEEDGLIAPIYTTPPVAQRQWVGLTPDDIRLLEKENTVGGYHGDYCPTWDLIEAVEVKLKEKNS
jgi:hypothetical protein